MDGNGSSELAPKQGKAFLSQAVHIPLIFVTNSVIIITILLMRKTITPYTFIVLFIAVTDLLVGLVVIPINIKTVLHPDFFTQSHSYCVLQFIPITFLAASSLSMLMLLSIDRFLYISFPYWYGKYITNTKMVSFAVALYVTDAVIYMSLFGFLINKKTLVNECKAGKNAAWFSSTNIFVFSLKLVITIACSAKIARSLTKSGRYYIRGSIGQIEFRSLKSKSKITLALTCLYVILWMPAFIEPLVKGHKNEMAARIATYHFLLLNSSVNALVYGLASWAYRLSFKFLLTSRPCVWKNLPSVLARDRNMTTFQSQAGCSQESARRTPFSRSMSPVDHNLSPQEHSNEISPQEHSNEISPQQHRRSTSAQRRSTSISPQQQRRSTLAQQQRRSTSAQQQRRSTSSQRHSTSILPPQHSSSASQQHRRGTTSYEHGRKSTVVFAASSKLDHEEMVCERERAGSTSSSPKSPRLSRISSSQMVVL